MAGKNRQWKLQRFNLKHFLSSSSKKRVKRMVVLQKIFYISTVEKTVQCTNTIKNTFPVFITRSFHYYFFSTSFFFVRFFLSSSSTAYERCFTVDENYFIKSTILFFNLSREVFQKFSKYFLWLNQFFLFEFRERENLFNNKIPSA